MTDVIDNKNYARAHCAACYDGEVVWDEKGKTFICRHCSRHIVFEVI